jgi:hypothetical protein
LLYVVGLASYNRNSEEYIYGCQGLKLLKEKRLARIIPHIHFKILVNSDLLTTFEIAENSQLILDFTKQFTDPLQVVSRSKELIEKLQNDRKVSDVV